jgi:hypothetical protein
MIDNDNYKPIKSLLKGTDLLPPVGLARLDSQGELLPMSYIFSIFSVGVRPIIWSPLPSTLFCIIRLTSECVTSRHFWFFLLVYI